MAGNLIRTIAYATSNGPNDGTDVGQIKSRVLSFSKAKTDTTITLLGMIILTVVVRLQVIAQVLLPVHIR
ncbi:MAG: hypothetical protein B6247_15615 [Candidatus Parabeggiatoa sp. nov. 2]|nr:MAG: hypothetical protein B6247_15615 [Beggiatoa sp. 4572_84]